MAEYWELEDWIEQIALMPIRHFYPTRPAKDLCLDLSKVTEGLLQLVDRGWLELLWEIHCPECFATTLPSKNCPEYGQELECENCHGLFTVDENTVFLAFRVTPEYKARVSKKKRKRSPCLFKELFANR